MSGSAFAAKGASTGPSTQTVWFGSLPDRLNCLAANSGGQNSTYPTAATSIVQCDYANLWTLNNVTLGSTTTAPDGTTANSQAILEDTTNGTHYLSSATVPLWGFGVCAMPVMRLAGIFKYSGRRVVLQAANVPGGNGHAIYTVFDLLNGQIGVAPTVITVGGGDSTIFTSFGAAITSLGNSWYLCTMDFAVQMPSFRAFTYQVYLDNGTGTGALSNSYTGNGSSGIFGWRTNCMPVAAYALNTVSFFDDFTSLSTIDVNNTQAAGFKWWPANDWTNVMTGAQSGPSGWSQAGSVVTLLGTANQQGSAMMGTATQTAPGSYQGQGFKPPFLIEWRGSWGVNVAQTQTIPSGPWGLSLEWLSAQTLNATNPTVNIGSEIDWAELLPTSTPQPHVNVSFIKAPVGGGAILINSTAGQAIYQYVRGVPTYQSKQTYNSGSLVSVGGVQYFATNNVPTSTPPPNATYWAVKHYPTDGVTSYPDACVFDFSQMHTYSYMFLPYYGSQASNANAPERMGSCWIFIDGLMLAQAAIWTPNIVGNGPPYMPNVERQHWPIFFSCDFTGGCPLNIDFVRVTQ